MVGGFASSIKLFRSWLPGHQVSNPFGSSSSGSFDSTSSSLAPSRGRHHRLYAPYPIPSTYGFNTFQSAIGLLSCVDSQQFDHHPFLFPLRKPSRGVVYAEVGTITPHPSWISADVVSSHYPDSPTTALTDGQDIPGSSRTPADFDWRHPQSTMEAVQTPSIPNHPSRVSPLPVLPVTQTDPVRQDVNYPTVGTNVQSPSSSSAHSPFRDTPTPAGQSEGGPKGKKRSRGRYRKEDPADRYLRENKEEGNRLWTCMWVEPSPDTSDSPAVQNTCGHQAPKSNARQHVKSRHLKLRYVSWLS